MQVTLFSDYFEIRRTKRDDWFDPILNRDTPLFVDPFLLFQDSDVRWSRAHHAIIEHFDRAFHLIAAAGLKSTALAYRKGLSLLEFFEPREFCLGYTESGTSGSGSGIRLAQLIAEAMVEAIERGLQNLQHFEELGILQEGINRDRISDITCNVLKSEFIKYTEEVAKRHRLRTESHAVRNADFDTDHQRWRSNRVMLPTNPVNQRPIILVPERFLRRLPFINARDWWDWYESRRLREDVNYEVMTSVRKRTMVETARRNLDLVREWVKEREKEDAEPYDISVDRAGVWRWAPETHAYVQSNPLSLLATTNEEQFIQAIDAIVNRFVHFVEERGGWRLLWNDDGSEKNEEAAQLVFYGIAQPYCEVNDIVVDREVDLGRGPVDFKFSGGYQRRALLEVKKLTSGAFWRGLENQLPSYMKSDKCQNGWFLGLKLRSDGVSKSRIKDLPGRVLAAARTFGLRLTFRLVDGTPKPSASRL